VNIVVCEQNTTEWYRARQGLVTASAIGPALDDEGNLKQRHEKLYTIPGTELSAHTKAYLRELAKGYAIQEGCTTKILMDQAISEDAPAGYTESVYTLASRVAAERLCPHWIEQPFETAAMREGHEAENRARKIAAASRTDYKSDEVFTVGLCVHDTLKLACSPDALVYDGGLAPSYAPKKTHKLGESVEQQFLPVGGIECKYQRPDLHVANRRKCPDFIEEHHKAQVHTCMAVTGAQWWDYIRVSTRELAPVIHREYRSEYTDNLMRSAEELEALIGELMESESIAIDNHMEGAA